MLNDGTDTTGHTARDLTVKCHLFGDEYASTDFLDVTVRCGMMRLGLLPVNLRQCVAQLEVLLGRAP